jgi:predicted acylesterase/phospholipase RssA
MESEAETRVLRAFEPSDRPRRVLAIDGGGIRGALAVGLASRLEAVLRAKLGRPDLVLADYFDLIGGTSTGAIVAAGLALGRDTDDLRQLYLRLGPRVFRRGMPRIPLIQPRFDPRRLEQVIREELGAATLETAAWKTAFAAVAKRVDTGSTWIWTNCPRSKYWAGSPTHAAAGSPAHRTIPNKDYPLAAIVQASAAAPFYFDMVRMEVVEGDPGAFFDGAVTPHNNPSLLLAQTALAPAYGFSWAPGADQLMIVSIGTGAPRPIRPAWARTRRPLAAVWTALYALTSMSYDSSQLAISMLQWLGTSPQPWMINREVGTLEGASPGPPLWTYVRYDAPLEAAWLAQHLDDPPPASQLPKLARLDDDTQVPALFDIGRRVGERLILPEHFRDVFDPAPPSEAGLAGADQRNA